jgi:hypothetical protein
MATIVQRDFSKQRGMHCAAVTPRFVRETASCEDEGRGKEIVKTGDKQIVESEGGHRTYWVMERPVGEFHRSFTFPSKVDQDGVKASLRNGILSVLVPKAKAQAPNATKITIE